MEGTGDPVLYNYEYPRRIRACFIGAGGHAFRNIYPTFRYAPVDLVAISDLDLGRANAVAGLHGVSRTYADFREMLAVEEPEAVFIVTSYEQDGRVQATDIALEALQGGAHVWMEKPTAASIQEIERLMAASDAAGRFVMTGLKKIFFPTIEKAKQIITGESFGQPTSVYVRYPQHMPRFESRSNALKVISLLDHIYHPAAILRYLMGPIERFTYEWEPRWGASVVALRFQSGAVGSLHLCSGISGSSPLERVEVVGEGANVVIDNGIRLTYYRRVRLPEYGRSQSFMLDEDVAPLHWEPEFSLGQLYNNNLFTLGYAQEVRHFCWSVLNHTAPTRGTLEDSFEIMKLFEALRTTDAGKTVVLNPPEASKAGESDA